MPDQKKLPPRAGRVIRVASILDGIADRWENKGTEIAMAIPEHSGCPILAAGQSTDEELAGRARKIAEEAPHGSELVYFLDEDSCEYETFVAILRNVSGGVSE